MKIQINQMLRQGDVKILKIDSLPEGEIKDARDNGIAILAYGEVTGHKHQISQGDVKFFTVGDANNLFAPKFLEVVSENAILTHEEHFAITLEKGLYEVSIQREYFPEEIRNVAD
jgi:hypothetical protein